MSNDFETYLERIIRLVGTIVIKHEMNAHAINEHLIRSGYIVHPTDRSTWKYYLNLSGVYHQYDHDLLLKMSQGEHDQMTIVVAGDIRPTRVNFNKELMTGANSDPILAEEYRQGTDYYLELVGRYPEFEDLINGILSPLPMSLLLSTKDGDILQIGGYYRIIDGGTTKFVRRINSQLYRDRFIEDYEIDIIFEVEEKIKLFFKKTFNPKITVIDDLYFPAIQKLLSSSLISVIHNIRLKNSHGALAHVYYVKAHLNSFGGLGRYVDNLKRKQYLWLYRNVEWLMSKSGTNLALDTLIQETLTPSYVPISAYVMSHDNVRIRQDLQSTLYGRELPLNFNPANQLSPELLKPEVLLRKEIPLARDNEVEFQEDLRYLEVHGSRSDVSRFNTKLLESTLIDFSNLYPVQLEWTLLNYWAYAIARGTYYGFVFVTHPMTGARMQLTMLNAFVLMLYCFNKGYFDTAPTRVPNVIVSGILRENGYTLNPAFPPRPSFTALKAVSSRRHLPDGDILKILETPAPSYTFNGSLDFYSKAEQYWMAANRHYAYQQNCQELHRTAQRAITARRLYWHNMPLDHIHTGKLYEEFLTQINFDDSGFERNQYLALMINLFNGGTGYVENVNSLAKNVQTACIAILKFFGSYSVHHSKGSSTFSPIHARESRLKIEDLSIFMESNYYLPQAKGDKVKLLSTARMEKYVGKEAATLSRVRLNQDIQLTGVEFGNVAFSGVATTADFVINQPPVKLLVLQDGN